MLRIVCFVICFTRSIGAVLSAFYKQVLGLVIMFLLFKDPQL